jgi:hypothetical protein
MNTDEFRIFPKTRMQVDFPWQIWAIGWLCVFKGIIWLAYEPNVSDSTLSLLGYKYMLQMIPLIIFGIGIWNLKRWAVWGAVLVACVNLILLIIHPQTMSALMVKSEVIIYSALLSFITILCNGPLGDAFILFATPILFKHTKKS